LGTDVERAVRGDAEGDEEAVQDVPVVIPPSATLLFEPSSTQALPAPDLEETGSMGTCGRVWVVLRPSAVMDPEKMQAVADAWASMLRGTLWNHEAFVYGLCLVLEAAAMDRACDGSLEWVRDNVGRYLDEVYDRLRAKAGAGA